MSVPIHAFDTVPIRADLRTNRDSGDVILDADGESIVFVTHSNVGDSMSKTFMYCW